jgi:hypothetical protein
VSEKAMWQDGEKQDGRLCNPQLLTRIQETVGLVLPLCHKVFVRLRVLPTTNLERISFAEYMVGVLGGHND